MKITCLEVLPQMDSRRSSKRLPGPWAGRRAKNQGQTKSQTGEIIFLDKTNFFGGFPYILSFAIETKDFDHDSRDQHHPSLTSKKPWLGGQFWNKFCLTWFLFLI
jgi:hypothetical protein